MVHGQAALGPSTAIPQLGWGAEPGLTQTQGVFFMATSPGNRELPAVVKQRVAVPSPKAWTGHVEILGLSL